MKINFFRKFSVEGFGNIRIFYLENKVEVENGVPAAAVILQPQVKIFLQNCVIVEFQISFKF